MRLFALAFLLGTWLLQRSTALPDPASIGLALAAPAVGLVACARWRDSRARDAGLLAFAFVLGFAHAAWRAEARLADALPHALEGHDVTLTGIVVGLPQEA